MKLFPLIFLFAFSVLKDAEIFPLVGRIPPPNRTVTSYAVLTHLQFFCRPESFFPVL